MRINWNEPRFGEEELKEVQNVLEDSYVNEGPKTKEFEDEIKKYLDVKYVILTANATAALFLSIKADSIIKKVKDFEVIIPNYTMVATPMSVEWAGGKPIIVDIESKKLTIDPNKIEEKINRKTISIIPVHILGRAAHMDEILEIANKNKLSIIEDAAGALGSKYNGKFLGTIGNVGCFSLQSNKIVTSGQGGIIVTNDIKYYEMIRRLRDFGRLNNKEFIHRISGYNLKFNDLSASLAIAQFRKIREKKKMLIEQMNLYRKELSEIEDVKFFDLGINEIPLWVDIITEKREDLKIFLNSFGIYPRDCWPALHRNPPYKDSGNDEDFPNSVYISNNCLWLPNGGAISNENIIFICRKIKDFYKKD